MLMKDFPKSLAATAHTDSRLLAAALDASSNGVVITDHRLPDEPIVYCNKAFESLTGYKRNEILGHNCRFMQGIDHDQVSRKILQEAIKKGEHCQVLIRNYRRNGKLIWNELMISPIKDADGVITHYIGIQNDVSERILAEEKLEEHRDQLDEKVRRRTQTLEQSESYLSAIVETIRESLVILDTDLRIVDTNQNFCDFFNYSRTGIIGKKFFDIGNEEWSSADLKNLLINVLPY
ncbi:MAG: PAS domain-containing protein, partial [Pedobacter sp.]